jgi:hypothetical protein
MTTPLPIFTGKIQAGVLQFDNPKTFRNYVQKLEGEAVEIVIRKPRSQRSLQANSYWWAVPVEIMADFMGEDRVSTHYALLGECWGYHDNAKLGKRIPNKGSSSALTVQEFSELIEWCPPWAMTTFGVSIPLPNEADYPEAMG